ncbi:3-oxoadipate enol-lactonase [Streptomyces sp. WMMC500]|uniref:bifunctional 3-oxoadipate enol-lactonase/4-carboxymuconolactone decarboxylase PcaDC n=1 Tax=Streptomyces sp. WMMC500 TaxID=3015154 RepID=UPI00248CC68D|nr:3-oxoadipate enol-lactonase [Streptomyces sp. WMMC500]WBB61856.1 3-oxoadipate enol-lactonase [Streptomyces sp. WMMC500]
MTGDLLHHTVEGPPAAPALLLGNSLGTSTALWDDVAPGLTAARRVVRWDLPGHGASPARLVSPGATVADLADRVLELADGLGLDRFCYAGVSLGGAIGLHLAAHHPERVDRLAVVSSSARFSAPEQWRERAALVRRAGTGPVAETAATRWFTPGFTHPRLLADLRAADPAAYAACCDALAAYDLRPALPEIAAPLLVVCGREDPVTPPAHSRELADAIPGATLTELPGASHLAPAERPRAVLAALRTHFGHDEGNGTTVRRAVLGDAHVDRAQAGTTAFTARFQDFISRYAWAEVWADPTLTRRERSLITLTALTAHGHWDELAMHVRAARTNGLHDQEIGAALLQTAVYCGVPAANKAFRIAQRELADEPRHEGPESRG